MKINSENVSMLDETPEEYWEFLLYNKYQDEYPRKAELDTKVVRLERCKKRIEEFLKGYSSKDKKKRRQKKLKVYILI